MKLAILIGALAASAAVRAQSPPADPPAPFTTQQRLGHYVHRTFSWQRMSLLGVDTAIEHVLDGSEDWNRGSHGFLHRYTSSFGSRLVRNSIELGAGMAFDEDTRFHPSQKRSFSSRLGYAAGGAVLARDRNGKAGFSYARLAATVGGTLITTVWRPCATSPQHYMGEVGFGYLSHLQNSLLTEFSPDLVRFGKKVRVAIFKR